MQVLHVLNELRPSGAEVMLHCSAEHWKEAGIKLHVLATGDARGDYAAVLAGDGYVVSHLGYRPSFRFARDFWRMARSVDVVHLHSERVGFLCGCLAALTGRRVVRTIHNNFDYVGLMRLLRTVQRLTLRNLGVCHVSIAPGVCATERAVLKNPTKVIENWLDERTYLAPTLEERTQAREELNLAPHDVVIALVGNCSSIKNHSSFIRAVAEPKPIPGLVVLHAGCGADESSEQSLADRIGVGQSIRFLGRVENPRVVYHAADAFVMPSLKEGFSIAALEALSTGLPGVVTRVKGLSDLGEMDEVSLAWASSPQPGELRAALDRLLQDLDRFRQKARDGAAAVRARYSSRRAVQEYLQIYRA